MHIIFFNHIAHHELNLSEILANIYAYRYSYKFTMVMISSQSFWNAVFKARYSII